MRRFGLADGVGIVAALTALAWVPGWVDPLTYAKLLVLAAGGLALIPAIALRVRRGVLTPRQSMVPVGAAGVLLLWACVATVGSGAPLWNSLYGWWGRGDGLLALLGAVALLAAAATLDRVEVKRAITWILGGACLAALVGLAQAGGADFPPGSAGSVTSLMGNTNFAAGYFAIIGALALGRALSPGALWERIWAGTLFALVAVLAVLTKSVQGPAALAAGVVALGVAYALLYRGQWRRWGLVAAGLVVAAGLAALVGSFFQSGPIAGLWSERTFDIRQQYWQTAIAIMNGQPIFGTGPDGFSRFVGEYRPESYVELLGPVLRVSAAHNVALQFGATLGYLGLLLWAVVFLGTGLLLLLRLLKGPVGSIALTASVVGAFTAYVVQGMVSIDMLPLLATGWAVAGLAIAMSREPLPVSDEEEPKTRRAKAARVAKSEATSNATPIWVPVTSGVLAVVGLVLVGNQVSVVNQSAALTSQEEAVAMVRDGRLPCVLRVQLAQSLVQQTPPEVAVPAVDAATALDPRCPPIVTFQADIALQQGNVALADQSTAEAVEFDPLYALAWALRARYFLLVGDALAAQQAAREAERVQALYPPDQQDPQLVEDLRSVLGGAP